MRPLRPTSNVFKGFEEGRSDNRGLEEFRHFCFKTKVLKDCPGSAYCSFGNDDEFKTEVIASIQGPKPSQRVAAEKAELNVTVEYSPFTRKGLTENSSEIKRMEADIAQCFESVILLDQYPKSRIDIQISVIQDNGEALCAAINTASLALVCAGIAVRDIVAATSAYSVLTLDALEKVSKKKVAVDSLPTGSSMTVVDMSAAEADFYTSHRPRAVSSVVLGLCPRLGGVAFVRTIGSGLSEATHELLLSVVEQGCTELSEVMREVIKEELMGQGGEDDEQLE